MKNYQENWLFIGLRVMKTAMTLKHTVAPHFDFQFTGQRHEKGSITAEGEIVHRIMNTHYFYNALGYTEEIRDTGLSFDDFVTQEYRNGNPNKNACLQAKLIEYLVKYSTTFTKKYAREYENWLGSCSIQGVSNSAYCTTCIKHPDQHEDEHLDFLKSFR